MICNNIFNDDLIQVPRYRNLEDDWDADDIEPMVLPYIPSVLGWIVAILFGSLFSTVYIIYLFRQKKSQKIH